LQTGILGLQSEKATRVTIVVANTVIENINENLHNAKPVAESILGFLSNVKQLEQ